ncbi:hypothetical protein [Buchananella felis]|uniref:hypothetical protein n=1 Tax=Buchananella felis TaxID=3231492 RepID=UPI003527130A
MCEFEDPTECMWDYGEKRRLPRPSPSQAPEVDWTRAVTIREVESINFAPPAVIMWPNTGDVLINLPTPVMTDAGERIYTLQFTTATVQVRATPFEYTWDFGDGTVETVDHPGLPDPQATYKHQYLTRAAKNRITLTTSWRAEFLHPRTGAWIPIEGSVQTVSYSRWFTQKMAVPFLTDEAEKLDGH